MGKMLGSDSSALSNSPQADRAIFSDDEPRRASSPPSSPPGFPWEQQTPTKDVSSSLTKPIKTAFSVLGKRKALISTSSNARPAKKPTVSSPTDHGQTLTQLQISLGQQVQKKCQQCGMEYVASSAEDRKLHDKYHRQNTEGYDVGKDFVQKGAPNSTFFGAAVPSEEPVRDRAIIPAAAEAYICAVDCFDKAARRKRAQAVMDIVQRELGAVPIPEKDLWDVKEAGGLPNRNPKYTMYMYVQGSKCVGFMLVEQIIEAYQVLGPLHSQPVTDAQNGKASTALSALKLRHEAAETASNRPLRLSQVPVPARMGISRIWVSPTHRRQSIAVRLLDTAYEHRRKLAALSANAKEDKAVPRPQSGVSSVLAKQTDELLPQMEALDARHQVAFSQPTEAGTKLAQHWFGRKYGWLVYCN